MKSFGNGPGSPKDLQGEPFQKDWPQGWEEQSGREMELGIHTYLKFLNFSFPHFTLSNPFLLLSPLPPCSLLFLPYIPFYFIIFFKAGWGSAAF